MLETTDVKKNDAQASVAQLVELLICNQWVGGSSPFAGSIRQNRCLNNIGGVPERPKGTDCKSVGDAFGGSNPPPTTSLKNVVCRRFRRQDQVKSLMYYIASSAMDTFS
jgi:hypothetical protein